jgi:Homing endonuclease associated repeat
VTKDEIIAGIRSCAEELGRTPSVADLKRMKNIGLKTVKRFFRGFGEALCEAGFNPQGAGFKSDPQALFQDWAAIVRKLGKVPSLLEYNKHSQFSVGPLITRFGGWTEVPRGLMQFAREKGLDEGWEDVIGTIERHERLNGRGDKRSSAAHTRWKDEPFYGAPLTPWTMLHAPTNEQGVLYMLGVLSGHLGMVATLIQTSFPDAEIMREVEPGRWQRIAAELEYESRNFLIHGHDPEGCKMIVCWIHNWPECPEHIEVVELSRELAKLMGDLRDRT